MPVRTLAAISSGSSPHSRGLFRHAAQKQSERSCRGAACRKSQRECGLDPDEIAAKVRTGIDEDASSPEAALGDELADEVARYRLTLGTALREAIIERVK